MSPSRSATSHPPFDVRAVLLADLDPLVQVLKDRIGTDQLRLVVSEEDLRSLGGTDVELDLGNGAVLVAGEPSGAPAPDGSAVASLAEVARSMVARAADLARAHARIRELAVLSTVDALTGLRNRRHFDRVFPSEVARRRRYERALTLLVLDLDHFKRLNDTYGHETGDQVLRGVGAVLNGQLRASDIAVRLGGEEFAAVLPETPVEAGAVVAERIRRAVAALDLGGPRVTVSVGIASVEGRWDGDASALLRAADQALYTAKRMGRNRVVHVNVGEGSVESTPR